VIFVEAGSGRVTEIYDVSQGHSVFTQGSWQGQLS
jgi:hypothetical protein